MTERNQERQVARWDPFAELGFPRDPWGDFPRFPRMGRWLDEAFGGAQPTLVAPAVDITESDHQYTISAEVPGVKREDLTLEVEQGVLTLRGEKRHERDEKTERGRRQERAYGTFSRSFSLPADADASKIQAEFNEGVLKVAIPKRPEAKPAQISIKG